MGKRGKTGRKSLGRNPRLKKFGLWAWKEENTRNLPKSGWKDVVLGKFRVFFSGVSLVILEKPFGHIWRKRHFHSVGFCIFIRPDLGNTLQGKCYFTLKECGGVRGNN